MEQVSPEFVLHTMEQVSPEFVPSYYGTSFSGICPYILWNKFLWNLSLHTVEHVSPEFALHTMEQVSPEFVPHILWNMFLWNLSLHTMEQVSLEFVPSYYGTCFSGICPFIL